jgi:hypothetical protein
MFDCTTPAAPPVIPPVTDGIGQLYVVPGGTIPFAILIGVSVNDPLHIDKVPFEMLGVGLIVMVTVKVAPVQPADNGVTV